MKRGNVGLGGRASVLAGCAALGLSAVVTGCGGTAAPQTLTTSRSSAERPIKPPAGGTPFSVASQVVSPLTGGRYRLIVSNTSSIGSIDQFVWVPPRGMTLVSVRRSSTGACRISKGFLLCDATLEPPSCTCRFDGGSLTVEFHARVRGRAGSLGAVHVSAMTPVTRLIPSFVGEKAPGLP